MSLSVLAPSAFAIHGDIGGVSGAWGTGKPNNKWDDGGQGYGVRLTAINANTGKVESASIDWTTCTPWALFGKTKDDLWTFGEICKQDYTVDSVLDWQQGSYDYYAPPDGFPVIISDVSHIKRVRDYFIRDITIKCFCADLYGLSSSSDVIDGTDAGKLFNRFRSGELALAIEPVAYFLFGGQLYGVTATEIALLAKELDPSAPTFDDRMKYVVGSLTHSNAPKSLFLEEAHPKLGYETAGLNHISRQYLINETIIEEAVGICIIWFAPPNTPDPAPTVYHHIYNLRINAPKGATFTTGGQTIPLTASNIAKILNGETITVDGTAVKLSLSMLTDLLRYCMNNGYISNGSGQTLGDGNWDEVISYQLDKTASNSGFLKDAAGNLIYKFSQDQNFAAQMSSRGVPYVLLSSEVTANVGADNKIYPGPETGNKDIVHYRYGASTGDFFTNAYADKAGTKFTTVEITWTTVLNRMLAALANYDGTPESARLGKCMFSDGGLWEAQTGEEYHTATFTITAEEEPTDIYYHTATYTVQLKDGDSTPTSLSQIKTLVGSPVWTVEKKTIDANTDKYNPALDGNLTGINCNANMGSQFFLGNDLQ